MRKKPLCLLVERKDPFEEELEKKPFMKEDQEVPVLTDKPFVLAGLPIPSMQATDLSLSGSENVKKAK